MEKHRNVHKGDTHLPKKCCTNEQKLYALRKQAVRLQFKGLPVMQNAAMMGLSWPGMRAALKRYEAGGMAALKPAIRGKKPGAGRSLGRAQERAFAGSSATSAPSN